MASKKAGLPIKQAQGSGKVDNPIPVQIVDTMLPKVSQKSDSDYQAEEMKRKAKYALEDIERAEGHKRDRELMKHVKKEAKEKIKTISKIC